MSSCLGVSPPNRAPRPPAAMIAETNTGSNRTPVQVLPLDILAEVLDRLANLTTRVAGEVLDLADRLVDFALVTKAFVIGQIAGRLLDATLDLVHLAFELVLIHDHPPRRT